MRKNIYRTSVTLAVSVLFAASPALSAQAPASSATTPASGEKPYSLSIDQALAITNALTALGDETKVDKNGTQYKARFKFGSSPENSEDVHWRLGEMVDRIRPAIARAQNEEQALLQQIQVDRAHSDLEEAKAGCPARNDAQTTMSTACAQVRVDAATLAQERNKELRRIHCEIVKVTITPPTREELSLKENNLTPNEAAVFVMLGHSRDDIEAEARESCAPGPSAQGNGT